MSSFFSLFSPSDSDPHKVKKQEDTPSLLRSLPVKEIALSDVILRRKIGKGRFSVVYHVSLTKACKGHTEAAAKRVLIQANAEIKMLDQLRHQHIVTILGFGHSVNDTFLFLELAQYGSLYDYLMKTKNQPILPELQHKWMKEAALAIEYLHTNNILHMDIKAKNCLVFQKFTLKLCDFGLASHLTEQGTTQTRLKGTWMFWAPELVNPREGIPVTYSKHSDIFAYGMLLLEICTRDVPRPGKTFFQHLTDIDEQKDTTPAIPETCLQDLSDLMRRCWNLEPTERPTIETILEGKDTF